MPSTYSPSLRIELIGNGEQSGTWGATTNNNMGTLIEQSITGVQSVNLVGGNYTLTNFNGLSDEARNAVLVFSGTLAAAANVIAPSVQKTYIITNNAGANVTIKTSGGNGVTVQNGLSTLVYCDGTDFYTAVNINNVTGNLDVSGNVTVSGGFVGLGNSNVSVASGNLTLTSRSNIVSMSTNTGAFIPPTGSTAQRPASPVVGMSRWNSSTGQYEIWNGLTWQTIAAGTYTASAVVIAGGGGGGGGIAGGGGAGGFVSQTISINQGTAYTVTVGAGGAAGSTSGAGSSGSNSSIGSLSTAIGGGGGGRYSTAGKNGGSGGGGGYVAGTGTTGQGYNGTATPQGTYANYAFGGGGGAGSNATASYIFTYFDGLPVWAAGNGGNGTSTSISGTAATYAGGGGGGAYDGDVTGIAGTGGTGGGGAGSIFATATAGTTNTGSGGGGGGENESGGTLIPHAGGAGGSGRVMISYANPVQRATGGTVTTYTSGGVVYWVHTFTSSGTFTA